MNPDPSDWDYIAATIDRLVVSLVEHAAKIDRLRDEIGKFRQTIDRQISESTPMAAPSWPLPEGYAGAKR